MLNPAGVRVISMQRSAESHTKAEPCSLAIAAACTAATAAVVVEATVAPAASMMVSRSELGSMVNSRPDRPGGTMVASVVMRLRLARRRTRAGSRAGADARPRATAAPM